MPESVRFEYDVGGGVDGERVRGPVSPRVCFVVEVCHQEDGEFVRVLLMRAAKLGADERVLLAHVAGIVLVKRKSVSWTDGRTDG